MFGQVRSYGNQQAMGTFDGANGFNWYVSQLPYVVSINSSTIEVVFNPDRRYWFQKSGSTYQPYYSFLSITLTEDAIAKTLTFVDNSNGATEITVFNSLSATSNPGQFVSQTDARGVTTTIASQTGSQINELQRSYSVGGVTTIQSLLYTYFTSGSASGYLQSVEYRMKVGAGSWTPVNQVVYDYYGASDANGSVNDLKSASQQLPDGSGGWNTVSMDYYRYWLASSLTGFAHGLKMHFGPEACRLILNAGLDLGTASDSTLLPYVDQYFEYDPASWAVTKEISAVCTSCPGGGTTVDLLAYSANPSSPAPGYNVWATKTVQTLPDSSQIVVYTNYVAQPMLKVTIDSTGSNKWATFYRYDDTSGQAIWEAHPSAVALPSSLSTLEAYDDLLNYNSGTGLYQYLNDNAGLINVTSYDSAGNVLTQAVRQGQSGTDVLTQSFTYTSNTDSDGNTVTPVATSVAYPISDDVGTTITTSYAYTWYSGTNQIQTQTTTLPVVASGQNGSGSAATIVEQYDAYGNLTQRTDERGTVNNYVYDIITSQLDQQVLNYQSGITAPGVNVTTDFTYDDQGRLVKTMGPSHTVVLAGTATVVRPVTWTVYQPSAQPMSGTWDVDQTWTGTGYATGTSPSYTYTLVDPVSINKTDKDGRSTDQILSVRSSGSGALSPSDTFDQTDWQSWSGTQYDTMHRTISSRVYFLIPVSGLGAAGTNYGQTDYGYDALERKNYVKTPGGTITRTVWTCPQWVASVWVGTDDTGATDANPAGSGAPNNMVMVTANVYDGGSDGGDGNLTEQTQYVSATSGDTRVTNWDYDFRDRRISMTGEIDVYAFYTYDNLDRLTETDQYDTSSSGNLIGRSVTNYDDRGRVYQQITYAVDPSTGTVGNALATNTWYDDGGNVLQQINAGDGQVFTKNAYNGMGWVTATYRGYNTSGTSYSQATTVANDTIFSQSENTYNEMGNVVSTAAYERLNDAPATGTGSTGALRYGSDPKARVSYAATWYDGIDRPIASANYGAIASFTRPDTPPSASDTILVSQTTYDSAGRVYQTGDPQGDVTQMLYDNAGRTTQKIEALGSGVQRTTNFTYTLDNQIATLTAINPDTGDQTTTYTYGTTLADSDIARNDLLRFVIYPDTTDIGWSTFSADDWDAFSADEWDEFTPDPVEDRVAYTYNRQGQQTSTTDQRGTVRSLLYDKLGRLTDDCVMTVGDDTDNAVLRISTAYEVRGMAQTTTSYDNAMVGSGTVLNQTKFTYNSFRQLINEQQANGGAVGGGSPRVQYGFADGSSNSNQVRPTGITYPNSRAIGFDYGTAGGVNDRLNRVASVKDGSDNLAVYTYLGAL